MPFEIRCGKCGESSSLEAPERSFERLSGGQVDLPAMFCPRCGYPLAECKRSTLGLTVTPDHVVYEGIGAPHVTLVIENSGPGRLLYVVDGGDWFRVTPAEDREGQIGPTQRLPITLEMDPNRPPSESCDAEVRVHLLCGGPEVRGTVRAGGIDETWVVEPVTIPIRVKRRGPVEVSAGHLVFGLGVDQAAVLLRNHGDVEVEAEVEATGGFQVISVSNQAVERTRFSLPPAGVDQRVIQVQMPAGADVSNGVLRVAPVGLPAIEVALVRVPRAGQQAQGRRYTVGIDFGTSKTAVAWVDNDSPDREPKLLEWKPAGFGQPTPWLPSAVFRDHLGRYYYGYDALLDDLEFDLIGVRRERSGRHRHIRSGQFRGYLFVGMKMFLHASEPEAEPDAPSIDEIVVGFFEYLFEEIERQLGLDGFEDVEFCLSLPVLDAGDEYERQLQRTRQAATKAGELFGIGPEQFSFEFEPVCAAADLIRLETAACVAAQAGPALQTGPAAVNGVRLAPGDWVMVFDVGAGTSDIVVFQLDDQDGELCMGRRLVLGYKQAGDAVDVMVLQSLIRDWSAHGLIGIPPGALQEAQAAHPAESRDALLQRYVQTLKFEGAEEEISRQKLYYFACDFKETHLNARAETSEVTLGTPLLHLGDVIGGALPADRPLEEWPPLNLNGYRQNIRVFLLSMSDQEEGEAERQLDAEFRQRLRDELQIRPNRITLTCPVGGGSLVYGWREAAEKLGLRDSIRDRWVEQRRLHVARGAALRHEFRVRSRLPMEARLEAVEYTLDGHVVGAALDEDVLPSKTTPGSKDTAKVSVELDVMGAVSELKGVLFRLYLGEWLVGQRFVSSRAAWQRAGTAQPSVRIEAALSFVGSPVAQIGNRLRVEVTWPGGGGAAAPPIEVPLPVF